MKDQGRFFRITTEKKFPGKEAGRNNRRLAQQETPVRKDHIKWILYIGPIEVLASYGFNFIHDRVETLSIDPKNLEKIQHDRLNEKSNVAAEKI